MNHIRPQSDRTPRKFRLDERDGKIAGVCSGIGNYLNIDPLFVRIGLVVGAIASVGVAVLAYLAIWLLAD